MPEEKKIEKAKEIDLKRIFADVLRGYSEMTCSLYKDVPLYIKHINIYDNVNTDSLYEKCLDKAVTQGLPTEDKQKEYLQEQDLWTEKQEREMGQKEIYIKNLKNTKSKMYLKSQIDEMKEEINEEEEQLFRMLKKRSELMGFTAEKYAFKTSNELFIQKALYKDPKCTELLLSMEDFNYLTDKDLSKIASEYNSHTKFLNVDSLKKISLMSFFCNYFYLCDDNPQIFYGKPVVDLTFYQAEMFTYGRYFKNLAQDSKATPPDEIRNDPDKLIEFYEARKNADEVMDKVNEKAGEMGGASSLVGATKEDLEALGYKQGEAGTVSLTDVANKQGGKMDMDDFIKLHE